MLERVERAVEHGVTDAHALVNVENLGMFLLGPEPSDYALRVERARSEYLMVVIALWFGLS